MNKTQEGGDSPRLLQRSPTNLEDVRTSKHIWGLDVARRFADLTYLKLVRINTCSGLIIMERSSCPSSSCRLSAMEDSWLLIQTE